MSDVKKIQEWALKSGFPFENDTLVLLNRHLPLSTVVRNTEFIAFNEDQKPAIRSVDFAVSQVKDIKNIPSSDWKRSSDEIVEIQLIIDCKYSKNDSYLFTPSTRPISISERSWPFLIPKLKKDRLGEHCNVYRNDLVTFAKVDTTLKVASSGRRVNEQTRERDSVASNLIQILQGAYHFIEKKAQTLGAVPESKTAYSRNSFFFVPIVVTNGPLLLLKDQLLVDQVEKSHTKDALVSDLDSVLVEMPDIYDLKESWEQLKNVLCHSKNHQLGWLENGLTSGQVLFCNLNGLDAFLTDLVGRFQKIPTE